MSSNPDATPAVAATDDAHYTPELAREMHDYLFAIVDDIDREHWDNRRAHGVYQRTTMVEPDKASVSGAQRAWYHEELDNSRKLSRLSNETTKAQHEAAVEVYEIIGEMLADGCRNAKAEWRPVVGLLRNLEQKAYWAARRTAARRTRS